MKLVLPVKNSTPIINARKKMKTFSIVLLLFFINIGIKAQWQQINSGLPGLSVYGLTTDEQYIYAGMSTAGVYRSSDKGDNWISVNSGLPASNAWELSSINEVLFAGFFGPGAFRSTDYGSTWDTLIVGQVNSSVRSFISLNNFLFAATWGNGVFRSSDGGDNWTQINNGLNYQTFWDIFAYEDTLLAAGPSAGVYRSTDNGNSWTQSISGLTDIIAYRICSLNNYIFVGTGYSGVFRSSDFGKSWAQVGMNSQTIYAFLSYDTFLFAGTSNSGVFVSSDAGNTWEEFNNGNITGQVVELVSDSTYIYAATLGGGVYRYDVNNISSVHSSDLEAPALFELKQNYPNPFNPSTVINYQLPVSGDVTLKVYDVLGNEIATLVNEEKPAGSYEVEFNASELSSGIYFYKLQAGDFVETKKMILLK
jgi:photosystem II stability/assembly factor-like uncharacterized protein